MDKHAAGREDLSRRIFTLLTLELWHRKYIDGDPMASPRNVLLITNLFPTPADPTRGIFTFQLASRLRSLCNLTVVCPLPWFPAWANIGFLEKWGEFSRIRAYMNTRGFIVHSPKYLMIPELSEAVHAALMFPSLYQTVKRLHRGESI